MVIVVMGAATALVSSLSTTALKNARQEKTSVALAQAKEALIGYAITYGDTHTASPQVHGYLPCPDIDGKNLSGNPAEGSSKLSCGSKNVSSIGRLPWKTLGLSALRDGDGECLWYAVSGTYQSNQKTDLMNWDTSGLFEVLDANGTAVAQDVVAVIFAPGAVLGNQNRAPGGTAPICGGNYTAINYLDSDGTLNNGTVSTSANATTQFRLTSSSQINDRMIFITKDDIWNALVRRNDFLATLNDMTKKVAECIADFGKKNGKPTSNPGSNKSIPWPAQLSLADYVTNTNYNDEEGLYAGRVPYKVDTARSESNNSISSDFLLQSDGANCPGGWPATYPWWNNWKDHLFYAIGREFRPNDESTKPCGDCLKINGSGKYAAVVIFSGRKLSALNQTRISKSVAAHYLEDSNAANINLTSSANGRENYKTASSNPTFNDILYCIKEDLSVITCPSP